MSGSCTRRSPFFILAILGVDRGDDEFHADGVDGVLEFVLLEEELVGVLEGYDVIWSGLFFDVRAGPGRFLDYCAHQIVVLGN